MKDVFLKQIDAEINNTISSMSIAEIKLQRLKKTIIRIEFAEAYKI